MGITLSNTIRLTDLNVPYYLRLLYSLLAASVNPSLYK